jgi:uncharacterized protein YjiS (DUF1127 family)
MMTIADNPTDTLAGTRALSDWIGRSYARWRRGHEIARTQLVLSELPDTTLRDIGLRRSEIGRVASHRQFTSRF